ncbi:MAG: protein kinase domain-containing protein, partial [Gemmatimonadales bacterium]
MDAPSLDEVQHAVGDRYEVLELAGAGGMGAVFRARHRALGHYVAIKVLPPEVSSSQMRQERFRREAAAAANLRHPHIVSVDDFDSRNGLSFLIMPFVRGVTLEQVLNERKRLAPDEVLRVVREIGAALDFAHRRGVVHRDVKPANIMVDEETGRTLLTDFGVARTEHATGTALTSPGAAIGTPDYMAPEQFEGGDAVDGRADLYALAVVAFEALTGTLPSLRTDRPSLARSLRAAQSQLSPGLATALVHPLAVKPSERPASAGAWLDLIPRASPRVPWRLIAASAAVALVAGVAWIVIRPSGDGPAASPTLAVMPFDVLRGPADLPARQLSESFARRLGAAPGLTVLSGARVFTEASRRFTTGALSNAEADSLARALAARYYVQPSASFTGPRVRLAAELHQAAGGVTVLASAQGEGPVDSLDDLLARLGEDVLRPILSGGAFPTPAGGGSTPGPLRTRRTLPRGLENIAAYFAADEAFRRADYDRARALFEKVIAADPDFAPAHFGRLLVMAQVSGREENLRQTTAGARRHLAGLEGADSLLLLGFTHLLDRGDGYAAHDFFRRAADAAPDRPYVRFVLGEFYLFFGGLFDQSLLSAREEFARVLDADPRFAPAIANSISLAHLTGDDAETRRLIRLYHGIDSTSVIAEVIGVADTLLFGRPADKLGLLNETLQRRDAVVLEYLAFQAAQFGTTADTGLATFATRRVLRALASRAADDYERALALRWDVAAELGRDDPDSARARIARATSFAARREADRWI